MFMCKRCLIPSVLAVMVMSWPQDAAAKACQPANTKITIKLKDPKAKIVHSKTVTEINKMVGNRDSSVGAGLNEWHAPRGASVTRGLTYAPLDSRYSFRPSFWRRGKAYCYSVGELTVNFGFKKHLVYIPRIYAKHSCEYKVVHAHEMKHVKINREALKKYLPKLKADLKKHLAKSGAVVVKNQQVGVEAMQKVISEALSASLSKMYAYSSKRHGKIDTPQNYQRENAKCKSWVRDVR